MPDTRLLHWLMLPQHSPAMANLPTSVTGEACAALEVPARCGVSRAEITVGLPEPQISEMTDSSQKCRL